MNTFYIQIGNSTLLLYSIEKNILNNNSIYKQSQSYTFGHIENDVRLFDNMYVDIISIIQRRKYIQVAIYFSPLLSHEETDMFYVIIEPIGKVLNSEIKIPEIWDNELKNKNTPYVEIIPISKKNPATLYLVLPNIYHPFISNGIKNKIIKFADITNLLKYGTITDFIYILKYCATKINYKTMKEPICLYFSGLQVSYLHTKISPAHDLIINRIPRIFSLEQYTAQYVQGLTPEQIMALHNNNYKLITNLIELKIYKLLTPTPNPDDFGMIINDMYKAYNINASQIIDNYTHTRFFQINSEIFKKIYSLFNFGYPYDIIQGLVPTNTNVTGGYSNEINMDSDDDLNKISDNDIYYKKYLKYKTKYFKHMHMYGGGETNLYDINFDNTDFPIQNFEIINYKPVQSNNNTNKIIQNMYKDPEMSIQSELSKILNSNYLITLIESYIDDGVLNVITLEKFGLNNDQIQSIINIAKKYVDTHPSYSSDFILIKHMNQLQIKKEDQENILSLAKRHILSQDNIKQNNISDDSIQKIMQIAHDLQYMTDNENNNNFPCF